MAAVSSWSAKARTPVGRPVPRSRSWRRSTNARACRSETAIVITNVGHAPIADLAHLLAERQRVERFLDVPSGTGRHAILLIGVLSPVSYTHLTLPTNREV